MSKPVVPFPNQRRIHGEACEWMVRLDGDNELSADELRSLHVWIQQGPEWRDELLKLAELWGHLNILTELAVPLGQLENRRSRQQHWAAWSALAACTVLAVCSLLFFSADTQLPDTSNGLYETAVGEQQRTTLADQSVVLLNTDSAIEVNLSDEFRDIRLLRGEAHFSVSKDANRPFRVFAGSGSVQAVGTGFSVYLRDNAVDVMVTQGSVVVDNGNNPTTLIAGQGANLQAETNAATQREEMVINQIETIEAREISKRLSWRDGILTFNGDSLGVVVEEISRYTTVSIEFSDPSVRSMRIGGRFPVGETDAMLRSLESDFGLHVTHLSPDRVLLSQAEH